MQQDISSRIDFLMRVTGTSNVQLARALSFDASYISRIRAGKRGLPPKLPFIQPAADFFARNVREGYQAEALAHELGIEGKWPASGAVAARLLAAWLLDAQAGDRGDGDAALPPVRDGVWALDAPQGTPSGRDAEARLFFGSAGRREAALAFLEQVADGGVPCELLLQSDEDIAWMYEDPAFAQAWVQLMVRLTKAGCTFTVVHTISRGGNEMWEGVRGWLPLYLTGAVRPYYYPRLRDGVRMRSLFVARGRCALVGNSVAGGDDDAMSVMLRDPEAVRALEHEYVAYLRLCRPLMQVERLEPAVDPRAIAEEFCDGTGVVSEIPGALVCVRMGVGALVVATGRQRVTCRIDEPRLVDAIAGYVDHLQ